MSVVAEEQSLSPTDNRGILANRIAGLLAWCGVFVTSVLTYSHFAEKALPCGVGGGCDAVTNSEYSRWFGVPVAIIGLLGYVLLAALSALRPLRGQSNWRLLTNISFGLTGFGFLTSLYFIFTSVSVLHQTCLWCIASAVIMTLGFFVTFWLWSCPDPAVTPERADSMVHLGGLIVALGLAGLVVARMDRSLDDIAGVKIGSIKESDVVPAATKVRGSADAPITIIEFADFNCPTCRTAAPTIQEVYENAQGKIRWGFRNVPLVKIQGHETSMIVATLSQLAAEKGLFWQFFDSAYRTENTERIKSEAGAKQVALDVGLKIDDISQALTATSSAAKGVYEDMDLSLRLGIQSTPTFLVLAKGAEPKAVTGRRLKTLLEEQPYKELLRRQ